jgi:hypothetical protein
MKTEFLSKRHSGNAPGIDLRYPPSPEKGGIRYEFVPLFQSLGHFDVVLPGVAPAFIISALQADGSRHGRAAAWRAVGSGAPTISRGN